MGLPRVHSPATRPRSLRPISERSDRRVVESVWLHFPPEGLVRGEKPGTYRLKDHDPLRPERPPMPCSVVGSELAAWVERATARTPEKGGIPSSVYRNSTLSSSVSTRSPTATAGLGRLVLASLLVQAGYPPAIVYKDERKRYLNSLKARGRRRSADRSPSYWPGRSE